MNIEIMMNIYDGIKKRGSFLSEHSKSTRMNQNIDILHATKFSFPKIGGIEHVVHQLAKSNVERGDSVCVVSAVEQGRGYSQSYEGIRTIKVSSIGVLMSVPVAPTYPIHLRRKKARADLTHYHLPDPLSVTAELMTGQSSSIKVATFHNDIARETHEKILAAYRPVLDRFLSRLDEIFVTSPRLRDQSPFLRSYQNKCTVIPLGIDTEKYGSYDGPTYNLPGKSERPTVFFVGRLIYYKGLKYLIDAMTEVDADLLIGGTGPLEADLRKRVASRNIGDRVHFLGYVEESKLHYCYSTADVFVLPSIATSEGFGLVQLEAMAYGIPVINTDINTGVPWVSKDGKTGLTVSPEDAGALAEALNELLTNEYKREQFGQAARARVHEKFTLDQMIERYLQRYDQYIN